MNKVAQIKVLSHWTVDYPAKQEHLWKLYSLEICQSDKFKSHNVLENYFSLLHKLFLITSKDP